MDPADLAVERFKQGYSCSQAVFSVCAERRGVDRDLAFRLAAGFGGGLARTAQICGCVTGAIMAIGLEQRGVSPEENRLEKDMTCETAREFMDRFAERTGHMLCRDLLGCDISTPAGLAEARRNDLFQSRCRQFVRDAVEIVEDVLSDAPGQVG
jgi:C_GCAxxG_C_C family probable redox protein